MDPMEALQLRIQHAWGHREDFQREWRAFHTAKPAPYRVWHEQLDPDGREYAVYIEPLKPIPDVLSFIAGVPWFSSLVRQIEQLANSTNACRPTSSGRSSICAIDTSKSRKSRGSS